MSATPTSPRRSGQFDIALAAGVNLIDTADVYSSGVSEEIVGKAVAGKRDDLLLATKARFRMGDGPNDEGPSRHHLIRAAEASLRRLGTDYIDLYQVHEWDGQTPLEETLSALTHLVDSGKVRYVGRLELLGMAPDEGAGRRRPQELRAARQPADPLLAAGSRGRVRTGAARARSRASASWSGLRWPAGSCRASTAAASKPPAGSRLLTEWNEPPVPDEDKLYDIVDVLVEIGEARGVSAAQVALSWTHGTPRRSRPSSSAPARPSSSRTTWPPPTWSSPTTRPAASRR